MVQSGAPQNEDQKFIPPEDELQLEGQSNQEVPENVVALIEEATISCAEAKGLSIRLRAKLQTTRYSWPKNGNTYYIVGRMARPQIEEIFLYAHVLCDGEFNPLQEPVVETMSPDTEVEAEIESLFE